MSTVKYKIKAIADDFGVAPKEVMEIVGKFFEKPKSSSQTVDEDVLNVVFDYLTQQHQIDSLEQVFAVQPKPKAEEPKAEAKPAPQKNAQPAPQKQEQAPDQPKAEKPKEPERKRERRVVDTSAVQVNSNRFADVDNLMSEREQKYQGGKQRIGGGKGKQTNKQQRVTSRATSPATRSRRRCAACRWRWPARRLSP